jgi:starch synthase
MRGGSLDTRTPYDRSGGNELAFDLGSVVANVHHPPLAVVSRLTWQKGIDLLEPLLPGIVSRGGRLIIYGQGDPALTQSLQSASREYSAKVIVHNGFDEEDAHLLHAGSDMIVQPSRFEPCGLTQLYALRYGAVPIVARTGGLAETIIDANEAAMVPALRLSFSLSRVQPTISTMLSTVL